MDIKETIAELDCDWVNQKLVSSAPSNTTDIDLTEKESPYIWRVSKNFFLYYSDNREWVYLDESVSPVEEVYLFPLKEVSEYVLTKDQEEVIVGAEERIKRALKFLMNCGQVGMDHHKAWTIDQAVRILAGDNYENVINEYKGWDEDLQEFTYTWDEGVAP